MESKKTIGPDLRTRVESGVATPDERREFMIKRDLEGLPGYGVYQKESQFTPEWDCGVCGAEKNPCAVSTCVVCGNPRPEKTHGDPEQGEKMGSARRKAGWRK